MKTIAIFPNLQKPEAFELSIQVRDFFFSKGISIVGSESDAPLLQIKPLSKVNPSDIELVISLGGDGSIMNFIHNYPEIDAPILGINIGTLGFLADVPTSNLIPALEEVLKGAFSIQDRLMLSGTTDEGALCLAMNEMVVHRGENHSLVDLAIYVDGKYLNTFSADGVIVATPSGSTAYSLSAGGPIISPELEVLVITPICPHTFSNRPIVIKPSQEIQIQYLSDYKPVLISFDGICRFSLKPKQIFRIHPASKRFRLVSLKSVDYFATLRGKLGWTGTLK